MRTRIAAALLSLFCVSMLFASRPSIAENKKQPLDPRLAAKIDTPVQKSMETRTKIPVIILGATQFCGDRYAFPKFCKKNSKKKRSDLRKETIEKLKEIADKEQPEILEALGNPDKARRVWLANAIFVTLSPDDIKKVAMHKLVKFVYAGEMGGGGGGGGSGKVSTVLEPEKREPFSVKDKTIPWNLKKIGAFNTWTKLGVTGEGVVVAMLDAGVNYTHQDLTKNIWINKGEIPNNGIDDDENGYIDDLYGFNFASMSPEVKPAAGGRLEHGTLTSAIVAGDGTGGTITGVAPRAKLMALMGMGGHYSAAIAFQYCLENGADIVNMSFSLPNLGNLRGFWRMLSDHATCAGLVMVSGAGNFQRSQRIPVQMRIPEGIPSVICAGGVDENMRIPNICSLGPVEWASVKFYEDYPMPKGLVKPDVCGFPGPRYPVIDPSGEGYIDPNNNIRGNSFSSPHVSGCAALILSVAPEMPAWVVKEVLERTATDLGNKGKDTKYGAGLANAYKAVLMAKKFK